jgi:hypothetical protein
MILLGLQRWRGSLVDLGIGAWFALNSKVFFRCPECGGTYDCLVGQVDANGDIDFGGWDGRLFMCQTPRCGYARFLRLEQWEPPQPFDLGGMS